MTSSKIELQVSDGMETSAVGVLRVSVVPLQVRLINNTGFQLVHNSFALITDRNLAFTTNAETDAEDGNLQLEYEIVEPAQFGVVERQTTPGPDGDLRWQATECFTGEMLAHEQVRYVHVLGNPAVDHFKFKVSVGQIRTNMLYEFRLTFIKLELYQSSNEELVLNNTREALITSKHLRFETRPLKLENDRIIFTVIRTPRYGVVHLSRRRLQARGIFTQRDLDTGQLRYRLHRRAFSHVRDELSFTVSATDCDRVTGVLTLRHVPAPSPPRLRAALRRLQLAEGSRAVIPATHLHFRADDLTDLVFNLTRLPEHGKIEVVDDSSKIIRDNTSHFTLRELNSDRVYYSHDDSESRHDSFHFMALSLEPEDFQYVGVFHIDIILKNDNSPVRVEEKVFHVVHGGARLITTRDLSYMDADLDTKPSDIVYTVQRSPGDPPNGGTFRADDPSEQMATFTQDDINKNLVLFKHQGKEYGKIALWISDGLFDVNGILEVQASPPFIKTLPTNGSVVENGKAVIITANDIQVDTNMNCLEEDIRYEVTLEPKHGRVEAGESRMFTQLDIVAGRVSYKHADINRDTGPSVEADQFTLKVMCLDTWAESVYPVKIYPSSYWEPLQIIANGPLYVEESTSVRITKDILEVMHPEIDPWNIIYKVKEGPEYGWLEASSTPGLTASENEPIHSKVFEQAVINANRLTYVQSGVNRTRDKLTMDVTNGILWLKDLQLTIIVIPERFYVVSSEITVLEGEKITIKPDLFTTLTEYYQGKVVLYKVIDKPKYGKIMLGDEELTLLPVLKLNSGNIQYVHDGSEEPGDSWQAVALTERGAESEPIHVTVLVRPVNDETPIVAANTGLCVWEGGLFTFTRNELYVTDMDTPAENVTISVVEVQSGYVGLLDKNTESVPVAVRRFTQADIDNRRVVFIHQNGTKGKMIFNVTDGIHELSKITFLISTKPVSLKVVCKEKLSVFPLMRVPLSDKTLMSDCSDHTRTIIYKIDRAPTLGRLIMINGDNHHRSIQQFTQKDVNSSLVYYEHTHPLAELTANDSFVFTVEAVSASPLKEQIFHIDISVSSGGLSSFVYVPPIRVNEGNEVPIVVNVSNVVEYLETRAGLRRPQIEAQWSRPAHGELKPPLSTLTRSQLETGLVVYEHDDSDTLFDEIDMCLYLLPDYVLLCNVTIPIHVIPVNDQPFRLVTDAPRIRVVRGENYTITKEDLLTEDADTDPAHILYDIIGGPTQGRLLMLSPDEDARVLDGFTQADINAGRILYEHSASSALQTATFYFRVWDGRFKPTYTVFTVDVVPVLLDASSPRPVYLRQGSNVAALTADQWHLETNARLATVSYNITRPPAHGTVCINQEPVIRFSHEQLVDGLVMFMQDDMAAPDDSFELVAYVRDDDATPAFTVPVAVQPLVALSPLHVLTERAKLTLNTMDATGLSDLAATDPVYTIIEKPKFGMIKKIIRTSGEKTTAREREIARFTHEDIKAGVIYYVPNKKLVELNGFEDSFKFLLAASMFQPAAGEVKIHIGSRQKKKLPGPNDPESHEGVPVSPTAGGYGTALAVALAGAAVAGAALAGAALVAARRWAKDRGGLGKTQSQGAVAPIPLPRPPDHLMPSPPHPHLTPPDKRCVQSERSVQSAQSVQSGGSAACKVTALADGTRYPYGADDHTDAEDWSSYEASESAYPGGVTGANPMLRRNQYWV